MSFDPKRTQPAVKLTPRRSSASVGASKLGGAPDVGPGFEWPRREDRPLQFLAQVDLADVARFPFASVLPSGGLLSFFYDVEEMPWGFDPKDKGGWHVHFEADPTVLARPDPPGDLPEEGRFNEVALDAIEVETAPPDQADDQDEDEGEDETPRHQLLGHPAVIQGEMRLECEMVARGLSTGDGTAYKDPRVPEMEAAARRWRLLLQLDTDDDAAMMWGDMGRLYFWITEDALRRRAFDEVWMVLQCS